MSTSNRPWPATSPTRTCELLGAALEIELRINGVEGIEDDLVTGLNVHDRRDVGGASGCARGRAARRAAW